MWEIIIAGGPVMWPIILCSVGAAAITLERLWTLQRKRVIPRELTDRVWKLVETRTLNDRHIEALALNSPLGRVLAAGLANRHHGREIMKEVIEDTGRHVVHELERFLNTLGTIAAISPLLGLLGTVTGMIEAFHAITSVGVGDPRALSGGIGEALFYAELARLHAVATVPHTSGGAIGIAAALQLISLLPDPTRSPTTDAPLLEVGTGENPWRTHVLADGWQVRDGWVDIPEGPGLGIEVDEAFVRRHAREIRNVT